MAESNLKEMMIDDINNDESNEPGHSSENQPVKIRWYLIDTERTFCKTWNFLITILTIYNMFVVPFIMVFPQFYNACHVDLDKDGNYELIENEKDCPKPNPGQKNLKTIEIILDVIYLLEIILNFFKKTRAHTTTTQIAKSYLKFYFIFDLVSIVPLFDGERFNLYWLKCFRFVHLYRLYIPLELFLGIVLSKYSKKRQSDLIRFLGLILLVIYVAHFMACIWIHFGKNEPCTGNDSNCTLSWIYANNFNDRPN